MWYWISVVLPTTDGIIQWCLKGLLFINSIKYIKILFIGNVVVCYSLWWVLMYTFVLLGNWTFFKEVWICNLLCGWKMCVYYTLFLLKFTEGEKNKFQLLNHFWVLKCRIMAIQMVFIIDEKKKIEIINSRKA